jgi:Lon protease-like protein
MRASRPVEGWLLVAIAMMLLLPALVGAQDAGPSSPLPAAIPLFPLPDVTLFPNTTQPFHIFEPRYRAMVEDALATDSIIGMVMLQPGFEPQYEGRPPIHAIGCAGVIVSSERLADGRFNIVVRGLTKFRVLGEDHSRLYRLADVEELPEALGPDERALLTRRRRQIEEALRGAYRASQLPPANLPDEQVIDGLSLILPLEPSQRQRLLEADGLVERAAVLIGLIRPQSRAE